MRAVRDYLPAVGVFVLGIALWEAAVFGFAIEFYLLPAPHVIGIAAHKPSGRVTVIGDGLRKPMVAARIINSCGGMEILRVLHNSVRSRMILVMTKEDTDRAIRQIHDGVKALM